MTHPNRPPADEARALTAVARRAGRLLATVLDAVGAVRGDRPLHPRGTVWAGTLTTWGGRHPWGTDLLDTPASGPCVVRVSHAVGLPAGWPDLHGLAVRLPRPGGWVDLLFASTGTGRLTRYVLLPRRTADVALTTLLPVRSARGPVQLGLSPLAPGRWLLTAACPRDPVWEACGMLTLDALAAGGAPRFDPVRNLPDGLVQYPWFAAVRDPSYVQARRRHPS